MLVDLENAVFREGGPAINVTATFGRREDPAVPLAPLRLSQNPQGNDGSFAVEASFGAAFGCNERFILAGQFDEDGDWEGTLTLEFRGDLCAFTDCRDTVSVVSGVRIGE